MSVECAQGLLLGGLTLGIIEAFYLIFSLLIPYIKMCIKDYRKN